MVFQLIHYDKTENIAYWAHVWPGVDQFTHAFTKRVEIFWFRFGLLRLAKRWRRPWVTILCSNMLIFHGYFDIYRVFTTVTLLIVQDKIGALNECVFTLPRSSATQYHGLKFIYFSPTCSCMQCAQLFTGITKYTVSEWLDRGGRENYYRLRIYSRCKLIPISQQSPSLDSKHSWVWVGLLLL